MLAFQLKQSTSNQHVQIHPMLSIKTVLNNLRTLRKSKKMRQEDIAEKLGVSRPTYVKKENGSIPINTEEWLGLSKILKVPTTFFFEE